MDNGENLSTTENVQLGLLVIALPHEAHHMRALITALVVLGLCIPLTSHADTSRVKDWVLSSGTDGSAGAYSQNDSGSNFGVLCLGYNQCLAYLASSTNCEDKSKYIVLTNTDSGANAYNATCEEVGGAESKRKFAIVFDDFDNLLNLVMKNRWIGFAIPLADGHFKVVRFSLEGSNEAISAMSRLVGPQSNPAKKTSDQVL